MPIERKVIGCIPSAFRLMDQWDGQGQVIWVPQVSHAYYITPDGSTLNLGDQGYSDFPNYTQSELHELIALGLAHNLSRSQDPT